MREEIIKLLTQYRLKEALTQMVVFAAQTSDWQLKNEIEALQTSYDLMLQYTSKGMKDPNKEELYNKMIRTAYELTDRIHVAVQAAQEYGMYYDTLRTFVQTPPHSFGELQLQLEAYTEDMGTAPLIYTNEEKRDKEMDAMRRRHETAVDELFEKIWVSTHWSEAEAAEARTLFGSLLIQVNDLSVMISAITMSLLHIFDFRKFMFLLDAYNHPEVLVNQRAIVGIALACFYYDSRIRRYPEAVLRMNDLNEDPDFIKNLYDVQIQLLQSARETRKIDKKMREEIIPEMMKNPKLTSPKLNIDEAEEAEDHNPEWEEWIDRSGITDKLRELGELQMSGADVYMSTFSQLKSFPFFRKIPHWFYPFDSQYPDIAQLSIESNKQNMSVLNMLMSSDAFCNSDKYSFCFTLMQMPENQRQFLQQQLSANNEASEELKERFKEMSQYKVRAEFVSRQYIQDLYRFFKLWIRRHEIHDIFEDSLDLWNKLMTENALLNENYINKLADYLFTHDYLTEAGMLYDTSIELYNEKNAELWQKAGYIYQKIGSYESAIDYYLQSDLLIPDNVWNNRHLAQCYKRKGNYDKALEYYKKVEQAQPDNLNLALQIGQCLMEIQRYDEALAYFFKVEYLDNKPLNARRAIGWCSFITGKYQEAKKYYDLLISEAKPSVQDWMNAGHLYYVLGDAEKAIEYYRKAQSLCGSHNEFIRLYLADKADLLKQGFNKVDIFILPDELI